MMFGLLLFLFNLSSRREVNEKLTAPKINEMLEKFFPEFNSIPHADTVARLLERIDPFHIERIHVDMIRQLIKNKKFKKLLVNGCVPISIDGTQKATRDGQLQETGWLLRTFKTSTGEKYQQYVFVLEANITFHNGLNIPLLTEYCSLNVDILNDTMKQDCEINAFHRLTDRLKQYFPRLKVMVLLDGLYACDSVISSLRKKTWEFMIKLPYKLKTLYKLLNDSYSAKGRIDNQPFYRERLQAFYWVNKVSYQGNTVHLVGCSESWKSVDETTGDIISEFSKHSWISSMPLSFDNVHELCNLAARKRAFIEDSHNTEKNRGYYYQHIFSYNWIAMQSFHYLMRLAHAINMLSIFTKALKKFVKELGIRNTFNRIFTALSNPWLSDQWVDEQLKIKPILKFQLE